MFELNITKLSELSQAQQLNYITTEFTIPFLIAFFIIVFIILSLLSLSIRKGREKYFLTIFFGFLLSGAVILTFKYLPNSIKSIIMYIFKGGT